VSARLDQKWPLTGGFSGGNAVGKEYANDEIVVEWNPQRCIHTGRCTAGLPEVFNVAERPWIQLEGARPDAVADVVARCPTGALRYRRLDTGEQGPPDVTPVTVRTVRNGPLYIAGRVAVVGPDGATITEETRLALCRCGGTRNAPFCDNSHRRLGFESSDPVADPSRGSAASPAEICEPQDA
jgi:uncharacterized Fe-S cluster protein YjdI/CDGSH-type Zn-finger protein